MYGSMKTHLSQQLVENRQGGMEKPERVITSPQSNRITTSSGQSVLNMCANNYLGLANHPAVMAAVETHALRERLLALRGLGKETVDTILLYACGKPVFVVDAYTRRIFSRYGLLPEGASYDRMQCLFTENLVPDGELFNDYHAQIVCLAKTVCRKTPLCSRCPIRVVRGPLRCAGARA